MGEFGHIDVSPCGSSIQATSGDDTAWSSCLSWKSNLVCVVLVPRSPGESPRESADKKIWNVYKVREKRRNVTAGLNGPHLRLECLALLLQ